LTNKNKLFDVKVWESQKQLIEIAKKMQEHFGSEEYNDFNKFMQETEEFIKGNDIKLGKSELKIIYDSITFKDEEAKPVINKTEKDLSAGQAGGTIIYESDSELRDSENVPLNEDIQEYFEREVLKYVPDLPAPLPKSGEFCVYIFKNLKRGEIIMTFNPDIHHRKSIRLKDYDYSSAGLYFITICTQKREHLFGEIVGAHCMCPNENTKSHCMCPNG